MFDLAKLYISHFTNMSGQQFYAKGPVDDLVTAYEDVKDERDAFQQMARERLTELAKMDIAYERVCKERDDYMSQLAGLEEQSAKNINYLKFKLEAATPVKSGTTIEYKCILPDPHTLSKKDEK